MTSPPPVGQRRDCPHSGRPHQHGTLLAYQKDTCRCPDCRSANAAATRLRNRECAYGRWHPMVDADLVRAHIAGLRSSGLGMPRLAELTGVSESWLRRIVHGEHGTLQAHVRADTAARLLAVGADPSTLSPNRKVDGTGTRRRLQALIALGWPLAWIAQHLGREPRNLRHALATGQVTARTASAVATLYEQLWSTRPEPATASERRAVSDALTMAAREQWSTPLAWDDIDHDPAPPTQPADAADNLDEIAVELAVTGHRIRLSELPSTEQDEVVRRLTDNGKSVRDIAEQLTTSRRTISRRRRTSAA